MLWLNFLQVLIRAYETRMRNGEVGLKAQYGELCKAAAELDKLARDIVNKFSLVG